jgi:hypothetical protein
LRPLLGDKIISWSLRTKDCNEAKLRNAAAVLKQAMIWERQNGHVWRSDAGGLQDVYDACRGDRAVHKLSDRHFPSD